MRVEFHPDARAELRELRQRAPAEYEALRNAVAKLVVVGPDLPYPHSAQIKGSRLRELRPRAGRSPWRAFYRQVGVVLVIGAVGPDARQDRRGFERSVHLAEQRISTS